MFTTEAHQGMGKRKNRGQPLPELIHDHAGVMVSRLGRDRGTPERAQHDEAVLEGEANEAHVRVMATPLDRYLHRGLLHADPEKARMMWAAGDKLRADFYMSGLSPKVTVNLFGVAPGTGNMTDRQVAARQRYRAAAEAMLMDQWSCLRHVVCLDGGVADWAALKGKRGTTAKIYGMTILQMSLEALAIHYGMLSRGRPSDV